MSNLNNKEVLILVFIYCLHGLLQMMKRVCVLSMDCLYTVCGPICVLPRYESAMLYNYPKLSKALNVKSTLKQLKHCTTDDTYLSYALSHMNFKLKVWILKFV